MAHTTEADRDCLIAEITAEINDGLRQIRGVNMVDFVGQLLEFADKIGYLHCHYETADSLVFAIDRSDPFVAPVARARGRIRGACANLAVRTQQAMGGECHIYGGEGDVEVPSNSRRLHASWKNTMHCQEFTLSRNSSQ